MRILWVKAGKLLPVDTGGKIRSYNLLRQLAGRHELTLLSYYGGRTDAEYEAALVQEFPGAVAAGGSWPDGLAGLGLRYARWLPTSMPFAVGKFTDPRLRALVAAWDREGRFDVIVCDFLAASGSVPPTLRTPTVLFQHNVESALWARQAKHERSWIKRAVFTLEAWKMAAFEASRVRRYQHVIAVSEHDRTQMARWTDASRISVTPTGVDVGRFGHHAPDPAAGPPLVVFVGSMDWPANADGIQWFCESVWPIIATQDRAARLRIVGRNPPPAVGRLASGRIEVTGTVPSVVEHLHEAAVVIVPLRIGGGTRLKIYEAMAARRPVVSTSVGAEGLDVTDRRDIVLADDAASFAARVVELLGDPPSRSRLGAQALATAARFDWPAVSDRFELCLRAATVGSAPP